MKVRSYLLVFAVAVLLPMIAIAAVVVVAFDRQQRAAVELGAMETARALMNAVDRELTGSIAALEALASARSLDHDDLATFYEDARRVVASRPGWWTIALIGPSGQLLTDTSLPLGASLPPIRERASFDRVMHTAAPVVGTVTLGASRHAFPIRVPVVRHGKVVYVLTAVVHPGAVADILRLQQVPEGWLATVFDASNTIVARTRRADQVVGTSISKEFVEVLKTAREGWTTTHTLEGDPVYTAFSRSVTTGWGIGLGVPAAAVDAPVQRSLAAIAGGGLVVVSATAAVSLLLGRRVARPIVELAEAARSFGRPGAHAFTPRTHGPEEVVTVSRAFAEASALVRAHTAERDEALRTAQAALAEAEGANRAKDEFLAMLGHELRNPVGAIRSAVAVLHRMGRDDQMAVQAREIIARQTVHLGRLIDDLLDVARVMAGKILLDREWLDLGEAVGRALSALAATGRAEHHAIVLACDPGVWVNADAARVEQIASNLIANALRYTPPGGRVTISVTGEHDRAVLTVHDSGVGMDAALVPRVFDLFVQGERPLHRTEGGLGIGLTLVRRLAELHEGTVEAHSEGRGRGSTFVVRLPRAPSPPAALARATSPDGEAARRRILLIEDNADAREMLRVQLELAGHEVHEADDGPSGIEAMRAVKPDVAFVDIGLPGANGYEIAREIRATAGWDVKLVALTGYGMPEDRRRALEAGFDRHVVKPADPNRLLALIAELSR